MIESIEWLAEFWRHRMVVLLCWSLILPSAWLATVAIRRLSPRTRSWIWRLAYLKLLFVIVFPFALELPIPLAGASQQPCIQRSVMQAVDVAHLDTTISHSAQAPLLPLFGLALAWCSGVFYQGARYVSGWRSVYRLVSAANKCAAGSRADVELRRLKELMSVRIPVTLLVSQNLLTPCVFGVLHPTIVIPNTLGAESDSDLSAVLAHELAHVARRDLAWNLVQTLVSSLLFFHPFTWIFLREWRLSQEAACDEIAISTTKSSPFDYAALIVRLSRSPQIPSLPPSAVGVSEFPFLKRRLMMLRDHSSRRLKQSTLGTLALTCVSVMLLAPWQPVFADEDAVPAPAYRYDEVAKSVMQEHRAPFYKLTVGGLIEENDDEYVPSLFMAKRIDTTISVGPKSKHHFTIGSRKGGKVELTCLWEQQVPGQRTVKGQQLWTSNFSSLSVEIELSKEVALKLVSPSKAKERKTLRVTVEAHVTPEK